MKVASVTEVESRFGIFLMASAGGPVVVTRQGRRVAVLVGVRDADEVERLLTAHSPHLRAILERSRQHFRAGEWLGEDEFWAQFPAAKPPRRPAKPPKKKAG